MAHTVGDLGALSLGRQFPASTSGVADLISKAGPVQSQTARSPYVGLSARRPGTTSEEITAAYDAGEIVRGSTSAARCTQRRRSSTPHSAPQPGWASARCGSAC